MAKPKPSAEDELDFLKERADTPTKERPPEVVLPSVEGCKISEPVENKDGTVPAENGGVVGVGPVEVSTIARDNTKRGRKKVPTRDPTNSVMKVRDAYRAMARVNRHSGQRRVRRFENAFLEDLEDEENLQEHLHVKVEWRSSFQTLLMPENSGLRDAFVKGDYPFDSQAALKKVSKRGNGKSRQTKVTEDPHQLFLGVEKRLRIVVVKCFERCEWYIAWLERVIQWYIHTSKSVLSNHEVEPIIEKNGQFPPAPKLPDSLLLENQEDVMLEEPQCFFLQGKDDAHATKEKDDGWVDLACPSIFLLLQLKDDSYMRLLSHATCQFYKLKTKTMACKNCKKAIVVQLTKKSPCPAVVKFSEILKANVPQAI